MSHKTDVIIIGAGPVGLFAVFELGLLNLKCHLIDNLDKIGGQCSELYPEKPIYDIPAYPKISGQELTDNLMLQIKPFEPVFHLNQQAESILKVHDGWQVTSTEGTIIIAKCVVIAAGAGSFVPRRPPLENIKIYEGKSIFYSVRDRSKFKNKNILIVGGGDSALDWANDLASIADVTLMHRRKKFRAAPDSVSKMLKLEKEKKIHFQLGQLSELIGQDGLLKKIKYMNEEKDGLIEVDFLLPFFGLKMELGPIASWGINLHENLIKVNTENFETSIPSIFAIGDINTYPGKLKLILCGFHEAALMAQKCFTYRYPNKKNIFRYTTSSKDLHKKLGV